jgi:hypothetical protein
MRVSRRQRVRSQIVDVAEVETGQLDCDALAQRDQCGMDAQHFGHRLRDIEVDGDDLARRQGLEIGQQ